MLALIPLGGSDVILSDICSREIENCGWGFEDMKSLKLGSYFDLNTEAIIDSNSGRRLMERWQLARNTQFPFSAPSWRILLALSPWPLPKAICSTLALFFSENFIS